MQIAEAIGAKTLIGIDVNQIRLRKARMRAIIALQADLNDEFPLRDSSVDVVIADQVIEHLIDLDNFCAEIYRVLRPNGCAVICTENLASLHNIIALVVGNQPYTGPTLSRKVVVGHHPCHPVCDQIERYEAWIPEHTKVMASRALAQLFGAYGFSVTRQVGVGFFPLPSNLASILARLDRYHASFIAIRAEKRE